NHLNRPEIAEALIQGEGQGVRRSNTLSKDVFYYAKVLDNGQILRVGKEAHSVISVLFSTLPAIGLMVVILVGICTLLSRYMTTVIVKPIEEISSDLDHMDEKEIYDELIPFTRKIKSQHEEILNAANMRQQFTANVSHELKTPLAAISGYAELMENGMANEKDIKHFSGEIRKSAGRLLNLINDILMLSKLDAGSVEEELEVVNLAEIAKESVEMLSMGASKQEVELSYEGVNEAYVKLGKELAQELLYNLIENAIRYNRCDGKVKVQVLSDKEVTLCVEDTGIGIPKDQLDRVFERFYRVDKSRSKQLGGTGLGLAIVKHICMITNGEITLASEEHVGTTIRVSWRCN
ncbi:MAG: HAMP domain-containing histidine kinase, partial [Erysipelotrichaceae bacterium]|nr:HAMP domain-containing histidine kinase [Erysipelotrichaceae bacterium]